MIVASATFAADLYRLRPLPAGVDPSAVEAPPADVRIVTSDGSSIPAHSSVLGSASATLEQMLDRPSKKWKSEKIVSILGVPSDAVLTFLRFLYSSRCSDKEMERYGIHLLVLSHVYCVHSLKQRCTRELAQRLVVENVVDVVQLAKLCDAPHLYLKCMKLMSNDFKSVEKTEGWKFLQKHDAWLELEILQFLDETESRKKRSKKMREEQSLYLELSEAMDCLEHICIEGCTSVGPLDKEPCKSKGPCKSFSTCHGLQLLIRHFATCEKKVKGGCCRCKRMWQLFRLHASVCDRRDSCKVPLCRQFKMKMQQKKMGNDARWRLLVRRVVSARAVSSLSLSSTKRKRSETRDAIAMGALLRES
ncbi:hypothetical protein Syun_024343 [Stephania yunnanensis]|uniref:BTB domain-containing protein n=1 Tax=Stephania yunnanensis TaxID=152371 RepID=A0AAP0I474_9MAGN